MQICAKVITVDCSFGAILGIIAKALEYLAQGPGCTQIGLPAVIFKADQCLSVPAKRDIPDAARRACAAMNGPGIEDSQTFHVGTGGRTVIVRQQLVATTDCQYG